MNNGYSICLNVWALDKDIKNELGLLLIISSLCAEKGYCYASNNYLAEIFDITEVSISSKISKLEKKGYISVEYQKRGCEIISRKIRLKNILIDDLKKFEPTIKKNFKENNISNNNININNKENINNINIINTKESLKRPTLEEIEEYIQERNMNVNGKTFYDYFNESNWVDSKGNKVKNWKQKLITWNSYNKKESSTPNWFDKNIKEEKLNKEEEYELEKILNEIGG